MKYLGSVVDDNRTAIAGLDYFYTLPRPYQDLPTPKVPRAKNTPTRQLI